MSLLDHNKRNGAPLADRMRPRTLEEFIGQEHVIGTGKLLRRAIEADKLTSTIFFGPPGTGKTTAADIIAKNSGMTLYRLNATTASLSDVKEVASRTNDMFGAGGIPLVSNEMLYYLKSYAVVLVLAAVGSTPVIKNTALRLSNGEKTSKVMNVLEPVAIAALLIVMTAYLVDGSFNPFLYFRF